MKQIRLMQNGEIIKDSTKEEMLYNIHDDLTVSSARFPELHTTYTLEEQCTQWEKEHITFEWVN